MDQTPRSVMESNASPIRRLPVAVLAALLLLAAASGCDSSGNGPDVPTAPGSPPPGANGPVVPSAPVLNPTAAGQAQPGPNGPIVPTAPSVAATTPTGSPTLDPQQVAQDVASMAVGGGALPALAGNDGQATSANCDPATVSNPPAVSAPVSASCDITYSDGSVWQQTITVTFDSQGNPVADSANAGIELSPPPTGG